MIVEIYEIDIWVRIEGNEDSARMWSFIAIMYHYSDDCDGLVRVTRADNKYHTFKSN